eukprot:jgi/Ulvmu1/9677/UM055_0015.1
MGRDRSPRRRDTSPADRRRTRSGSRERRRDHGDRDRDRGRDSDYSDARGERKRDRSAWDRDSRASGGDRGGGGYDRDAERRRRVMGPPIAQLTPEQQKQLEALQQAEMQRQLQRQQVLLNNGAGGLNAAMAANKKQREVYVGNLVIGQISDLMLRELFNAALAHFVADPVTRPPVVSVTMDGSGRFGFVELRTEELAAEAMKLDKVNLGGREINVGRPKGYIEPPPGSKIEANKPTLTLFMENLLSVGQVREQVDRDELREEVEEECAATGGVVACVVPEPPLWVPNEEPAPCFVRFESEALCEAAKAAMNGRTFEANTVTAKFISDDLWEKMRGGEWVDHKYVIDNPNSGSAAMGQVGSGATTHYPNLLPAALVGAGYAVSSAVPGAAAANAMSNSASSAGYVLRIQNLPEGTAKFDIVNFLEGCTIGEGHVRLVKSRDGALTGEAFVDCPSAESVARGMARDRSQFGDSGKFVYVHSSSVEDRNKLAIDGFTLV